MESNRKKIVKDVVLYLLFTCLFCAVAFAFISQKLTYLEYVSFNEESDSYLTIDSSEDVLSQEFVMPYEMLDSVGIKIGTFQRENNSSWVVSVEDVQTGETVCSDSFYASTLPDNGCYQVKFDKRIRLKKGNAYRLVVKAKDVNELTALAFYVKNNQTNTSANLLQNGKATDKGLSFNVYGGDKDSWWTRFAVCIYIYLSVMYFRFCYLKNKGSKKALSDKLLGGMIVALGVLLLLCSFSVREIFFTDEYDNMRGGMVIADGGVLYRDYVAQHTPLVYYLCAFFSLMGAGSVEQFRLSYYLLVSIIWLFLYIRNSDSFGKKKIALLAIAETVTITIMMEEGYQVLSDGIQGLFFVALILEFLQYVNDRSLDWKRTVILSICIWGSIGVAFISVYAIIGLVVVVIIYEVQYWKELDKIGVKTFFQRYYKMIITMIIPPIVAIMYFGLNHCMQEAFDQFYVFNREIYPQYSGVGENLIQPFVNGVQNYFDIISTTFSSIVNASVSLTDIIKFLVIVLATIAIVSFWAEREYLKGIGTMLFLIFSATRGYEFHGMAAWYIAILLVIYNMDRIFISMRAMGKGVVVITGILIASCFVFQVGDNLLWEQGSVSQLESEVIQLTENDENKDIFYDAYYYDSLYYYFKGRKPVNRAQYMLPWYMCWYEKTEIEDLNYRKPRIVLYNTNREVWGHENYLNSFEANLKQNYQHLGENEGDWKSNVWVRKENY